MPGLIPEHQTAEVATALAQMRLGPRMVAAIRYDLAKSLAVKPRPALPRLMEDACIDHGGTFTLPDSQGGNGDHEAEISLLGCYGRGPTALAAIDDWRKAALRMVVA